MLKEVIKGNFCVNVFMLLTIAIALEFLYRRLHEVLLHNHEIEKTAQKIAERKAHALAMQEAGVHK